MNFISTTDRETMREAGTPGREVTENKSGIQFLFTPTELSGKFHGFFFFSFNAASVLNNKAYFFFIFLFLFLFLTKLILVGLMPEAKRHYKLPGKFTKTTFRVKIVFSL